MQGEGVLNKSKRGRRGWHKVFTSVILNLKCTGRGGQQNWIVVVGTPPKSSGPPPPVRFWKWNCPLSIKALLLFSKCTCKLPQMEINLHLKMGSYSGWVPSSIAWECCFWSPGWMVHSKKGSQWQAAHLPQVWWSGLGSPCLPPSIWPSPQTIPQSKR